MPKTILVSITATSENGKETVTSTTVVDGQPVECGTFAFVTVGETPFSLVGGDTRTVGRITTLATALKTVAERLIEGLLLALATASATKASDDALLTELLTESKQ